MSQVIIYTTQTGNVAVCIPTGELPINEVLAKDCPAGAIIVDANTLPEADNDFFDAWRLNNGVVAVDLTAAKTIHSARLDAAAKAEAAHRSTNTGIGISNAISDADFIAALNAKRAAIAAATSTSELRAVSINDIVTS
jgi:hypothetical protein